MQNNNDKYEYAYSAPTQDERRLVESIRKQYMPESDAPDTEKLKKLDRKVRDGASAIALAIGIIGCLVFGLGLTLVLEWHKLVLGVIVSIVGFIPMAAAYPVHERVLKHNKAKYGSEILRLSEKILADEQDLQNLNE